MGGVLALLSRGAAGAINGALPHGSGVGGTQTWQLNNDGSYTIAGAAGGDWLTPSEAALAADWEVKIDVTVGAFATGATGTWLALSSSRAWTTDEPTSSSCTFTVSFRDKHTTVVRSTQAGVMLNTI